MSRVTLIPLALLAMSAWMPGCKLGGGGLSPRTEQTWQVVTSMIFLLHDASGYCALAVAFYAGTLVMLLAPLLVWKHLKPNALWIWRVLSVTLLSPWLLMAVLQTTLDCTFLYGFYLLAISYSLQFCLLNFARRISGWLESRRMRATGNG